MPPATLLLRLIIYFVLAPFPLLAADAAKNPDSAELATLVRAANEVLAMKDNVQQAKLAGKVFSAADGLMRARQDQRALALFQQGLQLCPWRLTEQLAYAGLLAKAGRTPEAREIAFMVQRIAESDPLYDQAGKILLEPEPGPLQSPDEKVDGGAWICLVRIGPVNRCVLEAGREKLQSTLGIPVRVMEPTLPAGPPSRSAFDRWIRQYSAKRLKWESPALKTALMSNGVDSPDKLPPEQILRIVTSTLKQAGLTEEVTEIENEADFFRTHSEQWDAGKLTEPVAQTYRQAPGFKKAVLVSITELDLYSGNSNYLFGMALTGGGTGIVSYARYRSDFWGQPHDRQRLITRMHKQLLSTIGMAIGVPRPTDPTSARSYPASLAEHDAKSEYMDEASIAGFEKALQIRLPLLSHKPNK